MRTAFSFLGDFFWAIIAVTAMACALYFMATSAKAETCHSSCIYVGNTPYCTTTCY